MFADREDAGRRLLERLPPLHPANTVVLALPRGGVPVADVIAQALGAPLDLLIVRKVGLPGHPELAVAAVTDGKDPQIVVNEDIARMAGLDGRSISALAEGELSELHRRRQAYLHGRPPLSLEGKAAVVVDDGIATGATMRAALRLARAQRPSRLLAAVPVAPPESLAELAGDCDEIVCLEAPRDFRAVSMYYGDFRQVSDAEVTRILDRSTTHGGTDTPASGKGNH